MKYLYSAVTALAAVVLVSTAARASDDRPPVPFAGAWSYSKSGSRDNQSWSESLSVAESKNSKEGQATRYADIRVEEMVNGVTHKKSKKHVAFQDVNTVLETLITEAKKGL